jgi:1,4-alpha-glucan branching enzyme
MFLEHLVERLTEAQQVELWTFRECRQRVGPAARVRLPAGSWGKDAGHEPWGNPQVWWMWHAVAQAERQLNELLRRFPAPRRTPVHDRLFCQALRELLLMQASDWSFLVVTGSARDYAEQRFTFHAQDFQRLLQLLEQLDERGELRPDGEAFLQALEQRDALFPELRLHWWEEPL